jgi:hypothetical protein
LTNLSISNGDKSGRLSHVFSGKIGQSFHTK